MFARIGLILLALSPLFGADSSSQVAVEITHPNGAFAGQLEVSMTGTMNKAKTEWNGNIKNISGHKVFRADFCVKAFDTAGQQIKPGGDECIISLWGWNWAQGAALNFKGKQDVKVADNKAPLSISKFDVTVKDVFDTAPNLRTFTSACPLVWPSAIRVFADRKFRPTVLDKDSFTATYAYDGGQIGGYSDAKSMLKAFTNANTAFLGPTWEAFRIDAASLYLREEKLGECTAEIKMTFAGYGTQGGISFGNTNRKGWWAVDSNFNFEKSLLDEIGTQAKRAADTDMDKAIRQLPTSIPMATAVVIVKPQLTITSQPDGAEIEINGEFIGNTPTTITTVDGKVTIKVTKNGYQPWERTLTLAGGDKRTIAVEMSK